MTLLHHEPGRGLFPLRVDPQPLRPRLDRGDGDVRVRQVEHHVELVAVRSRVDAGADLQPLRSADDDARLGERLTDTGEPEELARRIAVDPALGVYGRRDRAVAPDDHAGAAAGR